ncbi:anti-sigma factor [Flavobacterium sp. UBA6135]|uniref:anti-sigma factor n=1 Tax=Flavobacterium sp. UBA6135 TaxID=1946553 RepID=UPI0025C1F78F|nr:anti-sigma factor [Flavobacterium sp. UBA6135]
MSTQEYIESGILELYVYGKLSEPEMEEVFKMAEEHTEIKEEIIAIERAVLFLSSSVSPRLSGKNYENIKKQIFEGAVAPKVVEIKPKSSWSNYLGWAAALVFLVGGYYYHMQKQEEATNQIVTIENEKSELQKDIVNLELTNAENQELIAIIRDPKNIVVPLLGQDVAPKSYAKIYWNQDTKKVYVDGLGLPNPPEGMVYQVWSLKLNPLTPESIGLIDNFGTSKKRFFEMNASYDSEAFGITLEPAGGSPTPTLEQLFTLGKV